MITKNNQCKIQISRNQRQDFFFLEGGVFLTVLAGEEGEEGGGIQGIFLPHWNIATPFALQIGQFEKDVQEIGNDRPA